MLVVKISINFSWISYHFDVYFVCVAVSDHTYQKILVAVHSNFGNLSLISITPDAGGAFGAKRPPTVCNVDTL